MPLSYILEKSKERTSPLLKVSFAQEPADGLMNEVLGVMQEWKALSAMAVKWLGIPEEAVPFYSASALAQWRGRRILAFVLETGNFGHNKDVSYMKKYPYVIRKTTSLWRHTWDGLRQLFVFPLDSLRAWGVMIKEGVGVVRKGK